MYISKKVLPRTFLIAIFLMTVVFVRNGQPQEAYPSRPVTVVVPWGPGQSDTITRIVCKAAEKELGQPIIVENKPGASGTIGANYVFKSRPDGYTLGVIVSNAYLIAPHMQKVPYNPLTDSVDITTIIKTNLGFAVKANAPWSTFKEVIAYAKNNPGKFTYACAGVGVLQHITMERVAMKEGVKWTLVPFKSGGEAAIACLGGHTDAVAQAGVDVSPHVKAGKLKLLLTLGDKRWPVSPNAPTILEVGYDFFVPFFMALSAPRGIPESIIKKLENVFNKAKGDPSFIETMEKFQVEVGDLSGKAYSDLWRSKYDEMGKVIKVLGLQEK